VHTFGQGELTPHWDHGKNLKTHLNGHITPPEIIDLNSGTLILSMKIIFINIYKNYKQFKWVLGSIHLGPHFIYYLFLTAKKNLIFKIKLPDPIMKILNYFDKNC